METARRRAALVLTEKHGTDRDTGKPEYDLPRMTVGDGTSSNSKADNYNPDDCANWLCANGIGAPPVSFFVIFRQKRRTEHVKFNSYKDFFNAIFPDDRKSSSGFSFRPEIRAKSSKVARNSGRRYDAELSIIIIIISIFNCFCYMAKNIKFDCLSRLSLSNINFQKWNFQFSVL